MARTPELVRAAKAHGDTHLNALAAACLPQVYGWCWRLGGPGIDAEDAAHEVILTLCRRIQEVDDQALPAWLFAVTRRTLANHRRKAWFRKWLPGPLRERASEAWSPERTAQAQEAADEVWGVLESLPAAQREVLILCELEERTQSEAAALIGVPLGTLKGRLRASREAFRATLIRSRRRALVEVA